MKFEFKLAIFGKEKDEALKVLFHRSANDKEDFYPSLEEKAATLPYLVIKNQSFVNGNSNTMFLGWSLK